MQNQSGSEIRSWCYEDNKKITLFWCNGEVEAKIFSLNGGLEYTFPAHDIILPKEIWQNFFALPFYVRNSWIKVAKRSDSTLGLYVNSKLLGGGWFILFCSAALIVVGILLIPSTSGLAMVGSGAFIGAGIEGVINFDSRLTECRKAMFFGAVSGAVMGAANNLAIAIKGDSYRAAVGATAGTISQILRDKIVGQDFDKHKVMLAAIVGGCNTLLVPITPEIVNDTINTRIEDCTVYKALRKAIERWTFSIEEKTTETFYHVVNAQGRQAKIGSILFGSVFSFFNRDIKNQNIMGNEIVRLNQKLTEISQKHLSEQNRVDAKAAEVKELASKNENEKTRSEQNQSIIDSLRQRITTMNPNEQENPMPGEENTNFEHNH